MSFSCVVNYKRQDFVIFNAKNQKPMTKTEQFHSLLQHGALPGKVLFRPILMYFAANFIGKTYGEFASDYNVLVEANLRCMDEFGLDMLGLISDPYRETSAFGAKIQYVPDGVPRCLNYVAKTNDLSCLQVAKLPF